MKSSGGLRNLASARTAGVLQFLLVSGPSGAGKSTFIELMQKRLLPAEISAELPSGCELWPVIAANDLQKYRVNLDALLPEKLQTDGVVLHYDIVFPHRYGIHDYAKDPVADFISNGHVGVVICIRISRDRLIEQFETRLRAHMSAKSAGRRIWKTFVHQRMRRLTARIRGLPFRETIDLYRDPNWLYHCAEEWERFARSITRNKPGSKLVFISPSSQVSISGPSFQLARVDQAI